MLRFAIMIAAVGAFSCASRAATPPPDGWHRTAPDGPRDESTLTAGGAPGARRCVAGAVGGRKWRAVVGRDVETTQRTYGGGGIVAAAQTAGGWRVRGGRAEAGKPG